MMGSMTAKDLTKEAPASPRLRVGGYVLLARLADKGRADIAGTAGEYNFASPLDGILFSFKGVSADDVRGLLKEGKTNEEIAAWLDANGTPKTAEEIKAWGDELEAMEPNKNPQMQGWFPGACQAIGVDPVGLTLFSFLEADDKATFA